MDSNKQKSMTELMAEGLNDTPTLSRRERRMLAEAAEAKNNAESSTLSEDLTQTEEGVVDDTPTQEYTPVRTQQTPAKKPVILPDDDEEDEEEEEEVPVKPAKKSSKKAAKKAPKKQLPPEDDEDEDEDEDDEDEEVQPKRGRKSAKRPVYDDDDEDEDDEDDDDDDDYEDDDEDEEEVSFGTRVLGFLKALLVIVLLILLVILALRLAEAGGHINLEPLRAKVGSSVPFIHTLFPAPSVAP